MSGINKDVVNEDTIQMTWEPTKKKKTALKQRILGRVCAERMSQQYYPVNRP